MLSEDAHHAPRPRGLCIPARSLHPRELPLHLKGTMTKRILVPVGQSESHATMSVVRGLARDQGSLVRLLRVVPVPELVMGRYGRTIAYVDQEMERLTAQGLEELMCPAAELEGVPGARRRAPRPRTPAPPGPPADHAPHRDPPTAARGLTTRRRAR